MSSFYSLALFYLCLFLFLVIYRLYSAKTINIHSIWFSFSGDLPKSVMDNLIYLSKLARANQSKHNYQIYFWTNVKSVNEKHIKLLLKNKIHVKNYSALNEAPAQTREWLQALIAIGSRNEPFCYAMASDILRMHLLFREDSKNQKVAFSLYLDINDIALKKLPDVIRLNDINKYAFHYAPIKYDPVVADMLGRPLVRRTFITNDVIAVKHKYNQQELEKILDNYLKNFAECISQGRHVLDYLQDELINYGRPGEKLTYLIVFSTTHLMNLFRFDYDNPSALNLLTFDENELHKTEIITVQNVASFVDFERDYSKGFTWVSETADSGDRISVWQELLKHRYMLIHRAGLA